MMQTEAKAAAKEHAKVLEAVRVKVRNDAANIKRCIHYPARSDDRNATADMISYGPAIRDEDYQWYFFAGKRTKRTNTGQE